jgi:hypothetical protein
MEEIINFLIFTICGIAGVGILSLFKNKTSTKQNKKVVAEVTKINKKNEEMADAILSNLKKAKDSVSELEKEKNAKIKSEEELADWFNNRKPD